MIGKFLADEKWLELTEPNLDSAHTEFAEIRNAVAEGLEQAERGESRSAAEVFRELRAKHGVALSH